MCGQTRVSTGMPIQSSATELFVIPVTGRWSFGLRYNPLQSPFPAGKPFDFVICTLPCVYIIEPVPDHCTQLGLDHFWYLWYMHGNNKQLCKNCFKSLPVCVQYVNWHHVCVLNKELCRTMELLEGLEPFQTLEITMSTMFPGLVYINNINKITFSRCTYHTS